MTEDEAKTKWCPFARAGITASERTDVREPGQVGLNAARCIASACMAWRWEKVPNPDWQPNNQMAMYPPHNPYADDPAYVFSTTQGRCGLAGQQ